MASLYPSHKCYLIGIFIIVAFAILKSDAQCNQTSTNAKRFGTSCQYNCHCVNNQQCDYTTGECDSVCNFKWVGPACQYKNIAFGKESRHSDNIIPERFSDLANDPALSTCSFTGHAHIPRNVSPWWTLWLPYYAKFRKLSFATQKIYLPYFRNFNVSVQNYTSEDFRSKRYISGGVLCYQQGEAQPRRKLVEITCTGAPVGNLLRLQLGKTSSQLVLCDFRVYGGCGNGFYGEECKQLCSETCSKSGQTLCDDINGTCLNGCADGWKGLKCENACEKGKYGRECVNSCGNCASETCNHTNGKCRDGCAAGFKHTDQCFQDCDNSTYGINCSRNCSVNCDDVCDKVSGTCQSCKAGWRGDNCTIECQEGTWGDDCKQICGKCYSTTCSHVDGECLNGCAAGYKRTYQCNEECDDRTYGINCSNKCSVHCKNVCDKGIGTCTPCYDGWKGSNCSTECDPGYWGMGCNNTCGGCINGTTCNKLTGICNEGCMPGYINTSLCNEVCEDGTYGIACSYNCSVNCATRESCSPYDGTCVRCQPGWNGQMCETQCEQGQYGENCKTPCGACAENKTCDRISGICSDGCKEGYRATSLCQQECPNGKYGVNCSEECGNCKEGSTCNKTSGVCHEGCLDSYAGDTCQERKLQSHVIVTTSGIIGAVVAALIIACVIIFAKRRQTYGSSNSKRSADEFILTSSSENQEAQRNVANESNIYICQYDGSSQGLRNYVENEDE